MKKFRPLALAGLSVLAVQLAVADDSATNDIFTLAPVVVTATRIPTAQETTPDSVTIITRDQIAAGGQRLVADVLRGEPGVDVARTGQPDSLTSIFLRGANSDQTLVLVDGIRVNNGFNNSFDFSQLAVDNIERIEVLRGPQSTLYGSEALGGVINIVTKQGEGKPTGSATVEYGSFNSLLTRGSFAERAGKFSAAADASYASSDNDRINSDFTEFNFSGRARYEFSDHFRATLLANYLHGDDGTPNDVFTSDPNDRTKTENYLFGLTLEGEPTDWWSTKLTVSHAHERSTFNEPPPNPPFFGGQYDSQTVAKREQVDLQNIFTPNAQNKILVGGTFEEAAAKYTDNFSALNRTVDTYSGYLKYEYTPVQRLTLDAGGRVDDNSAFGTHETYRFGARFTAPDTETIFRASVGTGFRAPSISQLYYPVYGNPNLQPEKSFGWDAGFEQPLFKKTFTIGATFFHNDFDDLITGFPPVNVDRARTFGVETFANWTPATNFTLRASYTWTHSEDLGTGMALIRRPEHRGSVGATWKICPRATLTGNALFVGERSDENFDNFPSTRVTLPAYTKLDLGLNVNLTKNLSVYGRAENLLGQNYQDVYGFPALGRFFAVGVTAKF